MQTKTELTGRVHVRHHLRCRISSARQNYILTMNDRKKNNVNTTMSLQYLLFPVTNVGIRMEKQSDFKSMRRQNLSIIPNSWAGYHMD